MDAGLSGSSFQRGDGPKPVPSGVSPLLGRGMGAAYPVLISGVADWNRNEPSSLVRFHTHQDASPALMRAFWAGLSDCGSATRAPRAFFRPRLSAISAVTGWIWTPIQPRVTAPWSFSCATTTLTVSAGISKAMPTLPPDGEKIAVLTPMTLPSTSNVGPPELPLFTAASI